MGDLACTIMGQKDFPSFGWWLEQGATTTWEQWDGKNSRNHPMFGGGLTWFSRILAGVDTDPENPGFKHFTVRPIPCRDLREISYMTATPYGEVSSRISHDGEKVSVEVTVPNGSTATVFVPKCVAAASEDPLSDDNYTIHEAGPGRWRF